MSISLRPAPRVKPRQIVDPAVFAECMISRDLLERADIPQDDLLGLRNLRTGEMLFVEGGSFRRWMREFDVRTSQSH